MIVRKITITDHSPEQGDLRPDVILEIEITGKATSVATEAICNRFKDKIDHSILVEDLSSTRNVVYSKEAWKHAK